MVRKGPESMPASGRRWRWWMAFAIIAVATTVWPAAASETDQFLVWGVELEDGAEHVNLFLNLEFEHALARLERAGREPPCPKVAEKLYKRVFASMLSSRLRRHVETSEIDSYPQREVGYWQYQSRSVFRDSVFPAFVLVMARTVRIGEVYLGIDKLAHMFGIGRRYHVHYQRLLRRGLSPEEAQRRTVLWGLKREKFFLGGIAEGIISHADLEANFQGLRLAREMCEGERPYLTRGDGAWRLARPVDVRAHVNPAFDESYNSNQYLSSRWRAVRQVLLEEYCPRYESEQVQARLARYREIDQESASREIIASHYQERGRRSPRLFSIDNVCTGEQQERSAEAALAVMESGSGS